MGNSAAAGAGVIVHDVDETAVLLFDELEGEESLVPVPIEHAEPRVAGIASSATRADGTLAFVLDVAAYLTARRAGGSGGAHRKRSQKR
jgi:chemotaxis protein histidine kinase CheA